jgi:hypothetical protein
MDYATDARQVHQIIKSLVQGESGENWIKHIDSNDDGRQDFFTLRNFYHGQGNANRRIQEADRLLRELFYKGAEKTFSWERYVKEFKRMCDIYEEEGQPLHDKLKTRSFLERIQVPSLRSYVEILQNEYEADGLTWDQAANRLANQISKFKSGTSNTRLVGAAATEGNGRRTPSSRNAKANKGGKSKSVKQQQRKRGNSNEPPGVRFNADGSVYTGLYHDWSKLSDAEKAQVTAARDAKRQRQGGVTRQVAVVTVPTNATIADVLLPVAPTNPVGTTVAATAANSFGGRSSVARDN